MSRRHRLKAIAALACVIAVSSALAGRSAFSAQPARESGAATAPGKNGRIAFRRYLDTNGSWGAVFTIDPSGKNERQVSHPPKAVVDDQPEWAPDGSLITFTRCAKDANCAIYVVRPDGSGLARLSAACPAGDQSGCVDDSHPSFSPDSQRLVFVQAFGTVKSDPGGENWIEHSALTVMNRDGTSRKVLYEGARFSGDRDFPVFSPDGKQLLFEWHASGFTTRSGHQAIFTVGADGANLHRLTSWAENDGDNPDWSPDGKWIVFRSHEDQPQQSQIFLIRPDGSGRKQLTHFKYTDFLGASSFSPSGKAIAFGLGRAGTNNVDVYVMRVDGTHMRRVTRSKLWDSAPDWGSAG
jgi:TolB protein